MPYQPQERLHARIKAFMAHHRLTGAKMATILGATPYGTFRHWVRNEVDPPACMVFVMETLERFPEVRKFWGIKE